MRVCRFRYQNQTQIGFYDEQFVTPINASLTAAYSAASGQPLELPNTDELLDFLPPDGEHYQTARQLTAWLAKGASSTKASQLPISDVALLKPIPWPNKLFLLAGNYAQHIEEGGGVAAEQAETCPYVFMKPPTTTLTDPNQPVKIPNVSPAHIDWELELGVIIGRGGKHISEAEALAHVAGYTVINDISDRRFHPNEKRKPRDKDSFFDWLHGKWHDSFCPIGPCVVSADAVPDPQTLPMQLKVNGNLKQDASTSQQIFPVAAVVEFISHLVTLEAGDIISTGTPSGVGATTGDYLKEGDLVEASIGSIGVLVSPIENE